MENIWDRNGAPSAVFEIRWDELAVLAFCLDVVDRHFKAALCLASIDLECLGEGRR